MSANVTLEDSSPSTSIMKNKDVPDLFSVFQHNQKNRELFNTLINHMNNMEVFVQQVESKISNMKLQIYMMKTLGNRTQIINSFDQIENLCLIDLQQQTSAKYYTMSKSKENIQ